MVRWTFSIPNRSRSFLALTCVVITSVLISGAGANPFPTQVAAPDKLYPTDEVIAVESAQKDAQTIEVTPLNTHLGPVRILTTKRGSGGLSRRKLTLKPTSKATGGSSSSSRSKSFSSIQDLFEQCSTECNIQPDTSPGVSTSQRKSKTTWTSTPTSQKSKSTSKSSRRLVQAFANRRIKQKNGCCSGGVSSLRLKYHAVSAGSFSVDVKGASTSRSKSDSTSVKIVACDRCFPIKEGAGGNETGIANCNPETDIFESVIVLPKDEICLVSWDDDAQELSLLSKMPTNVQLLYNGDDVEDSIETNLHTSCSKPVYPPFAVTVSNEEEFLNLSDIGPLLSSPDTSSSRPILEFIDGTSASTGILFSDCDMAGGGSKNPNHTHRHSRSKSSSKSSSKNSSSKTSSKTSSSYDREDAFQQCCKGGATYLKMELGGEDINTMGTLTTELPSDATCGQVSRQDSNSASSDVYYSDSRNTKKTSSSSDGHRYGPTAQFVPCDCVGEADCDSGPESTIFVQPFEPFCIARWDEQTAMIDLGDKLPKSMDFYFVPNNASNAIYSTSIHTSCSKPLHAPFKQEMENLCDSGEDDLHISFIDGTSKDFHDAFVDYRNSHGHSPSFDISFAGCGCIDCPTSSATPTPSVPSLPSAEPSAPAATPGPTLAPFGTSVSSLAPSAAEEGNPPVDCNLRCEEWVAQHCNLVGDDGSDTGEACVPQVADDSERLLFVRNTKTNASLKSAKEQVDYHQEMIALLGEVARALQRTAG